MDVGDLPTLGVRVTLEDDQQVKARLVDIGTTGEQAATKVGAAFASTGRSTQILEQQLQTLTTITSGWNTFGNEAREKAMGLAAGLQAAGGMAGATAAQFKQLADAQAIMAATGKEAAASTKQITDATRAATLEQMRAIEMNDAFNGKFIETRKMVLDHAAALKINAAASAAAAAGVQLHGLQLGRVNQELGTFGGRLLGANTAVTRLTAQIGGAVVGYGPMIAGMLAIEGALYVFDKMTEKMGAAKKAQDALTDALLKWYEAQGRGAAADQLDWAKAQTDTLAAQQKQVDALQASLTMLRANPALASKIGMGDSNKAISDTESAILRLSATMQTEERALAANSQHITQIQTDAFNTQRDAQAQALATRIKFNADDAAARKQALDLLKQDQALYAQYSKLPVSDTNSALVATMAQQITTLRTALFPKGPSIGAEAASAAADLRPNAVTDDLLKQYAAMVKTNDEITKSAAALELKAKADQAETAAIKSGESARATYAADLAYQTQLAIAAQQPAGLAHERYVQAATDAHNQAVALATVKAAVADQAAAEEKASKDRERAAKEAQQAAQERVKTMLREMQRGVASVFDNMFTNGIRSFGDLFDNIKALFFKMLADIAAARVMSTLEGPATALLGGMLPGMGGLHSTAAGAGGTVTIGVGGGHSITMPAPQAAAIPPSYSTMQTAGAGLGIAGAGFGVGSLIGGMTTNRALGALGGAAGGAASGAAIGSMGGPIGVAAGAVIGGLAGLAGGLFGASAAAKRAAEALEEIKRVQIQQTLADWAAEVSGSAAAQKAAAEIDLKYKYLSIRQMIDQVEAGKKMEEQRNKDLTQADATYAEAQKKLINGANALTGAFTDTVGAVQGYKLTSQIYTHTPAYAGPVPATPATTRTAVSKGASASGGGDLTVNFMVGNKKISSGVLTDFRNASQAQYGTSDRWPEITEV